MNDYPTIDLSSWHQVGDAYATISQRIKDKKSLSGKFACLDVIVRTYFIKPTFLEKLFFGSYVRKLVKEYY